MSVEDIDAYLALADVPWPADALQAIIGAIRSNASFDEAIKWRHPYFSSNGHAVMKLFAAREWVNIFYYRGIELDDPNGLLAGEGTSGMRRQRIYRTDPELPLTDVCNFVSQAALLAGHS